MSLESNYLRVVITSRIFFRIETRTFLVFKLSMKIQLFQITFIIKTFSYKIFLQCVYLYQKNTIRFKQIKIFFIVVGIWNAVLPTQIFSSYVLNQLQYNKNNIFFWYIVHKRSLVPLHTRLNTHMVCNGCIVTSTFRNLSKVINDDFKRKSTWIVEFFLLLVRFHAVFTICVYRNGRSHDACDREKMFLFYA